MFIFFLETSRVSGNTNPLFALIFLIIITMLTDKFTDKFLHFDLLNGDGGTTIGTIFMCHLFFFRFTGET